MVGVYFEAGVTVLFQGMTRIGPSKDAAVEIAQDRVPRQDGNREGRVARKARGARGAPQLCERLQRNLDGFGR